MDKHIFLVWFCKMINLNAYGYLYKCPSRLPYITQGDISALCKLCSMAWQGFSWVYTKHTNVTVMCAWGLCVYVGGVACISVAGCVFVSSTVGGKGGGGGVCNWQFYLGDGLFACVIFQFSAVTRVLMSTMCIWVVYPCQRNLELWSPAQTLGCQ